MRYQAKTNKTKEDILRLIDKIPSDYDHAWSAGLSGGTSPAGFFAQRAEDEFKISHSAGHGFGPTGCGSVMQTDDGSLVLIEIRFGALPNWTFIAAAVATTLISLAVYASSLDPNAFLILLFAALFISYHFKTALDAKRLLKDLSEYLPGTNWERTNRSPGKDTGPA